MPAMKRNQFAALLDRAINASSKTQAEIAEAMGYDNANIITMFKKGTTRVPLEKIAALARALDLDPAHLMRQWFLTYMPDVVPSMEEFIGTPLTRSERSWVDGLRKTFGTVPPWDTGFAAGLKSLIHDKARHVAA